MVVYRFMEDRRMQKKGESSMVLHKHTRLTPIQRKEIYRLYIDEGYCYLKFDERGSKYLPIKCSFKPKCFEEFFYISQNLLVHALTTFEPPSANPQFDKFLLHQNYPNPASVNTTFSFSIPANIKK